MLTQDKSLEQVKTEQSQQGIINPSRQITKEDELYLRDYTLAAAVISWDRGTYNTPQQVTPVQITNIALTGDTVWYQIDFHQAIPLNIETFHAHRLQIWLDKAEQEQPAGYAGDSVSCQLRPNPELIREYEQGEAHGLLDASAQMPSICTEGSCAYSAGYLEGYSSFTQAKEKTKAFTTKPPTWSVTYNNEWQWYVVWVGDRAIGRALTHEAAEQIAQKYIADGQAWQQHRERVLASYAD
ncbi:hypothetical protein [Aliterella atlantica]|uniref:Uncharacterized protein n=1 Tax=Aliterella atlantica CENA595 TaxID=1618023 RepID=A0A0D8ZN31_9CYAN|nr:hypothetical protein [Aliterella atlantica]KJH69752.1 hypothetical protein UH38_21760 [Aliterella atlantica CENA595]